MTIAKHDAFDTGSEDRMSSHVNQASQTVFCKDEATMDEELFSKAFLSYVGQCLTGEAKFLKVLPPNVVGDGYEELIGKCQELLGVLSVRSYSASRWVAG